MTEREARIAFNLIPSVGSVVVARLAAAAGGSVAAAYEAFPDKKDWNGKVPDWQGEIERAGKKNIRIITELDPEYPPALSQIASPPLALYVVGNPEVLSMPGVAMVGTRNATEYGRTIAERFSAELAQRGWVIFSGLARGIDGAAHRGALIGGGLTVGVLGGALDCFYPEENRALAREMVNKGGCVISEFALGRPPDWQTFPQRNRIVSALSRGIVAVECPKKSGTLITCSRAAEQGRTVMAVPGRVDWKTSEGCLNLIRQGARLVASAEDIIEEITSFSEQVKKWSPQQGKYAYIPPISTTTLRNQSKYSRPTQLNLPVLQVDEVSEGEVTPSVENESEKAHTDNASEQQISEQSQPVNVDKKTNVSKKKSSNSNATPSLTLSEDEIAVYQAISEEGTSYDQVVRATGLPASKVNVLVVGLRLKGKLRLLGGNRAARL